MNNVVLIGRLTKDPELRYTAGSQMAVTTFNLAIDRVGAKEKTADFIRIKVFGKMAENCEKSLAKGRLCGIQGSIQTGQYKNQAGETVYTTEVVANRVEFLQWGEKTPAQTAEDPMPEGFSTVDEDIPF